MKANLFIIGAMKSSTTTLHAYLQQHPAVFMCEPKEPSYFAPDTFSPVQSHGLGSPKDYERLFDGAAGCTWRGDASTNYAKWPHFGGVPERVAAYAPDARILYLLRDPVQRALSHYWHRVRAGLERRNINDAFGDRSLNNPLIATSAYGQQMRQWMRYFPSAQIRLMRTDELHAEPQRTMADVFAWLDLDIAPAADLTTARHNPTPDRIGIVRPGRDRIAGLLASRRLQAVLDNAPALRVHLETLVFQEWLQPDTIDSTDLRLQLRALFADDIRLLEDLTRTSFQQWYP